MVMIAILFRLLVDVGDHLIELGDLENMRMAFCVLRYLIPVQR